MNKLFRIFQIDEKDAAQFAANPEDPHIHDYEELIIGVKGSLEHFIDFETTAIDAPFVSFVTKGKVHRAIPHPIDGAFWLWILRFKSEFIPETIFQLYSTYHNQASLQIEDQGRFHRLIALCEIIEAEMKQDQPDLGVARYLLSALFIMIESERKPQKVEEEKDLEKTHNTTLQSFLSILEDNFRRPAGADFYAEKLFMSTRNLNLISKSILHQTVSEIIETRKLIEAKNLLVHSDKSISEIGFELGYKEKSYFSSVFKKRSGQTPTEFREEMRSLLG